VERKSANKADDDVSSTGYNTSDNSTMDSELSDDDDDNDNNAIDNESESEDENEKETEDLTL
jgi:hypothetical protein